jgi:predicted nucleic acid-binding Zn ribbon protein
MSDNKPLKDVINQMLRAYGLGDKLDEMSLVKSWEDVVGKMIAKHTSEIYFKSGILYVKLDSATVRQELSYAKSALIEQLNRKAGKRMLTDIIFK